MSNPGNMTYDESDHPRMGNVRSSSAKDEILIKPKLGAGKRCTRDLPSDNFIYGVLNEYSPTVKELMVFRENVPDPSAAKGTDLRAMNKKAPKMKVTRADEQRMYRREHPIKLKVKQRLANVAPLPSVVNPDHVYGTPLERGDSMDEVIRYAYGNDFIRMNTQHHHDFQVIRPVFVPVKNNKTTDMRIIRWFCWRNPPRPKQRFVISKFKNVPHKIDNVQKIPLLRDERPPVFPKRKINKKQQEEEEPHPLRQYGL
ncbi:hypothetical protein SELMODRAFT_407069 [Selaginella moellendorffii]|uniref:Uncharacterized protein n=1 Tax=Selaginella moellendorffii TaxID=88036 RepID=D8R3T8_SELML|nr:hypothetical protein SELMODRAFT_407069 [Selaginella moellendorffii]